MSRFNNRSRAITMKRALCAAYGRNDVRLEPDCAVIDALTDLRHFCDKAQLDFGECDRIAHGHYPCELEEERRGDKARPD